MSLKTHATLIDDIQAELGSNTTDFTDALLTIKIAEGLQELSKYSPFIVREVIATTDDSKELDINYITNLLWISALEFKVGKSQRQWRNFTQHYRNKVSMEIDFWPSDTDSGIDTDEALDDSETGVDCDADVTGSIAVGDIIRIDNELMLVSAIGTSLTVVRGYNNTTAAAHSTDADIYLPELAYLYCAKAHKVPALTDLAGAVDYEDGYAANLTTIHIDGMGATDTLETDFTFTIASDSTGTRYRLIQDTTLADNEGDITFQPGLAEAITDGDVVTFDNSTLTPNLETLLIDLVAARSAISIATKLMMQVNTGGISVPRDMKQWGYEKLAIVLGKLEREARKFQRPTEILPRSA